MLDIYQREGMFPTSLPNGGHFFNGPIRSHYRPRRLWSLLILMLTTYITLPPVFFALYALFCSGLVNVLIAFALILSGIIFFSFLFFGLMLQLYFLSCSIVAFALYKLVGLTRVSKGSAYGRSPSADKQM